MDDLAALKQRWFIDTGAASAFPPQGRHPGSQVLSHTDGNRVEPLIDGAEIMGYFDDRVEHLLSADDPSGCLIWLAAMGIEPVKLRGETSDAPDAFSRIVEAAAAGVSVTYLGSGQANLARDSLKLAAALKEKGGQGAVDKRYPFLGGHHQKFNVTRDGDGQWEAVVSSADFFYARWDDRRHAPKNPDRQREPTHDMALKVAGPAVHDIGLTFAERWNDHETSQWTSPPIETVLDTAPLQTALGQQQGTQSVQLLRNYPLVRKRGGKGFSWSGTGETTIWAAYLQAIRQARQYIYLEDQYLYPLGDPPFIQGQHSRKRETDFVYQLGEAIKRGVDVIALVPGRNDSLVKHYEMQHRRRATHYLHDLSTSRPDAGRFIVSSLRLAGVDPTIHSKLMIVDDEFVLAGSANICQRSIGFITELHLGVVDGEGDFARDLRLSLWQEHMEVEDADSLLDIDDAVGLYHETAAIAHGRLRLYPARRYRFELPYRFLMNRVIDPYKGPNRT